MKLEHTALSISKPEDIKNFYQDILGMEQVKEFTLSGSLANDIFGIEEDTTVFLCRREQTFFELFLTDRPQEHSFNHTCLAVDDRKSIFHKAQQKGYNTIHKQKEHSELLFIKDNSGNVFELKTK